MSSVCVCVCGCIFYYISVPVSVCVYVFVSSITYQLLSVLCFDVFGPCVCERVRGVRLEYKGSALILSTAIQYLSLSPVHVLHIVCVSHITRCITYTLVMYSQLKEVEK